MNISYTQLLRDAWRLWRGDWRVLTAVAGPFLFLPILTIRMLIADLPLLPASVDPAKDAAAMAAYEQAVSAWLARYGAASLIVNLVVLFGQLALVAVYLAKDRPTVGEALRTALVRYPVLLLVGVLAALPMVLLTLVVMVVKILAPAIYIFAILILARLFVTSPVLIAERPIGPLKTVLRSLKLTHGETVMLGCAILTVLLVSALVVWPFATGDRWLLEYAPNPIARSILNIVAAAVIALSGIATALLQVVAWRRLSSR